MFAISRSCVALREEKRSTMWFRLDAFDYWTLSCVIGQDMHIYVRAFDVAKIMGYVNAYGFARRYSSLDISDVVPANLTNGRSTPMLSPVQVCQLMKQKRKGDPVYFKRIFEEGRVRRWDNPIPELLRQNAPRIVVDLEREEDNVTDNVTSSRTTIPIGTWIEKFKNNLRDTFYRRKEEEKKQECLRFDMTKNTLVIRRLPNDSGYSFGVTDDVYPPVMDLSPPDSSTNLKSLAEYI